MAESFPRPVEDCTVNKDKLKTLPLDKLQVMAVAVHVFKCDMQHIRYIIMYNIGRKCSRSRAMEAVTAGDVLQLI